MDRQKEVHERGVIIIGRRTTLQSIMKCYVGDGKDLYACVFLSAGATTFVGIGESTTLQPAIGARRGYQKGLLYKRCLFWGGPLCLLASEIA